jgi:predicted dehydrogenase
MDFSAPPANFGEYRLTYRTGDMVAPQIEPAEPLSLELQDFASAILEGTTPVSSSRLGLEVVLGLQALERSLESRGEPVTVPSVEQVTQRRAARATAVAGPARQAA